MDSNLDFIKEVLEAGVKRGDISEQEIAFVEKELSRVPDAACPDEEKDVVIVDDPAGAGKKESQDLRAQIQNMTIPQKIKLAMMGNSVARSLLIFNPNKMIQEFVLKNPRLSEPEVQAFLKSPNISDHALRFIASDKNLMKSYTNRVRLVSNPKTPGDVSMKWIRYLTQTDLKKLSKSRNVPNVVQTMAKRLTEE